MAGEWVKMRADLFTHPKVFKIASALNKDELYVVGALLAFWSWAHSHAVDGRVDGATSHLIDRATRAPGLSDALVSVGWLEVDDSGITIPRFEAHNSDSAKERTLKNERQSRWRERKKNGSVDAEPSTEPSTELSTELSTEPSTREEKRREEIKVVVLPSEQSAPGTEGFTPTPSGQVGQALKRAGISLASVSLPDPRISALLEQGATPEEFEAVAREAVERQIAKPVGWICSTLAGRRSDAAKLTLAPAQPTVADRMAWRKTTDGVLAMGQELGVQSRDSDTWEAYERRVLSAFQRREAAKETS